MISASNGDLLNDEAIVAGKKAIADYVQRLVSAGLSDADIILFLVSMSKIMKATSSFVSDFVEHCQAPDSAAMIFRAMAETFSAQADLEERIRAQQN
jgi:GTPase Era involved in 16S rRNA processing